LTEKQAPYVTNDQRRPITRAEVLDCVQALGADSWPLLNYCALPSSADKKQIIEALQQDAQWLKDHCNAVLYEFSQLIVQLESGGLKEE